MPARKSLRLGDVAPYLQALPLGLVLLFLDREVADVRGQDVALARQLVELRVQFSPTQQACGPIGHLLGVGGLRPLQGRGPGHRNKVLPRKDGVIADVTYSGEMVKHFNRKVHKSRVLRPSARVLV